MRVTADVSGERLDAFLSRTVTQLSRSGAQKLLEGGRVTVNGKAAKKNTRLNCGDTVEFTLPEAAPLDVLPTEMELDIVYQDEDIVVLNKPKGLVVHPAAGHQEDTLVNGLLYLLGEELSGINGVLRPGIVHRIDKDTSGLLVVAKNDFAHGCLAAQLQDHSMSRTYEAIVCGSFREDNGTVRAPIGRHKTDRKKMCVTPTGKEAVTTGRWWPGIGGTHTSAAAWKQAAPIKSGSTWRISAIPSWETRSMGTKSRSWARRANACTPGISRCAGPATTNWLHSKPLCLLIS